MHIDTHCPCQGSLQSRRGAVRMTTHAACSSHRHDLDDVPILCIDPWTGDQNMWLNRVVRPLKAFKMTSNGLLFYICFCIF